jgi:8-oxo-dGTP diphosphatase
LGIRLYGIDFRGEKIANMKGLILLIIAVIIGVIVIPFAFVYSLVTVLGKNLFLNYRSKWPGKSLLFGFMLAIADYNSYFKNCAISIDQAGNTVGYKLFNDILIKDGGFKFGNPDETISSVLGKNLIQGKLRLLGRWLNSLLNLLDPGHTIKSIEK